MKMTRLVLMYFLISGPAAILGAAEAGTATVKGLLGLAQYSRAGGNYRVLKPGTLIQSGDLIQTATDSALDLDCGSSIGTIRLLQSTTLSVPTVSASNLQFLLKGGEILGEIRKRPPESKLQIEVPYGVVGVIEGEFRLSARGHLVVVEGTALFVDAPSEGEPVAHVLTAKPGPVYYGPGEKNIRPAPKELEREVRAQLKARLPRK